MAEYPNNSYSAREKPTGPPPDKKVEKVVTGSTKTRVQLQPRKIAWMFIPEDLSKIKSYILTDVLEPGIKNVLAEIVSVFLFGETGRIGGRRQSGGSKIAYQKMFDDRRDDRREYARSQSSASFGYEDIIFIERRDAEVVLEKMEEAISMYDNVSVGDLYDMAGVTCNNYMANNYGWTDIRNAKVARDREGYYLQLPRPQQLK